MNDLILFLYLQFDYSSYGTLKDQIMAGINENNIMFMVVVVVVVVVAVVIVVVKLNILKVHIS